MTIKSLIVPAFILMNISGCQAVDKAEGQILYVSDKQVDCYGIAPQTCMLVKSNLKDDWEYFYDEISGFNYKPGYQYKLQVKKSAVKNPQQDASSLKYQLIKVITADRLNSE